MSEGREPSIFPHAMSAWWIPILLTFGWGAVFLVDIFHLDGPGEDGWTLAMGIGVVALLQILFTYTPPFQELFETATIPLWVWPWLFAGGLVFFLVVGGKADHSHSETYEVCAGSDRKRRLSQALRPTPVPYGEPTDVVCRAHFRSHGIAATRTSIDCTSSRCARM